MKNKESFFFLYFSLLIYSVSGVISKLASKQDFLSITYLLCFGGIFAILGIYALLWQQVLNVIPFSVAMANKPIVLIYYIFWSMIFFDEKIGLKLVIGIILILSGIMLINFKNQKVTLSKH